MGALESRKLFDFFRLTWYGVNNGPCTLRLVSKMVTLIVLNGREMYGREMYNGPCTLRLVSKMVTLIVLNGREMYGLIVLNGREMYLARGHTLFSPSHLLIV